MKHALARAIDLGEDYLPAPVALRPDINEACSNSEGFSMINPFSIDQATKHGAIWPHSAYLFGNRDIGSLARG